MTPYQITIAKKLQQCSFLPGSFDKRFARDIAFLATNSPDKELTEKQAACLDRLVYRYRRQIGVM